MSPPAPYRPSPERFSRRWWSEKGRMAFWVVLVTVLVWMYADMEFTETVEMSAAIRLTTRGKRDIVLQSERLVEVTSFEVRGSRAALERFRRDLNENGSILRYDVAEHYGPGRHTVPVTDILAQDPRIAELGLTVLSAAPSMVPIELDRIIEVPDIPVEVEFTGGTLPADQPPAVEPRTMTVRVAESDWKELILRVPAAEARRLRTAPVDLRTAPVGEEVVRLPAVVPEIAGVPVTPSQPTVKVTFRVARQIHTKPLKVAVRVLTPANWAEEDFWKQYRLVRKDNLEWRPELTCQGAREALEQLSAEKVDAYVQLGPDDTRPVASWLTRRVDVRLPRALEIRLVGEPPSVSFKLEKRTAASPS